MRPKRTSKHLAITVYRRQRGTVINLAYHLTFLSFKVWYATLRLSLINYIKLHQSSMFLNTGSIWWERRWASGTPKTHWKLFWSLDNGYIVRYLTSVVPFEIITPLFWRINMDIYKKIPTSHFLYTIRQHLEVSYNSEK